MNVQRQIIIVSLLTIIVLLASACSPAVATAPAQYGYAPAPTMPSAPKPPAPTQAPLATPAAVTRGGMSDVGPSPYQANRMIIKNGEMSLLVADTDQAVDRVTSVAVETGGYIVSSKTWVQDGFKYASLTMGVPADQFEVAQRRLRALAVQVLSDTASGQDVSDEYVDTQSRLANLEATAARIREFLRQAKDVDEALAVNAKLTEVEAEIEKVKGRMQYLKDRAAFSTLAVNLEPQRPTPTPTLTPTVTPTPTPDVWRPGRTFQRASGTLGDILRALADVVIYLGVVLGPFVLPPLLIVWALVWRGRRRKARPAASDESAPAAQ